MEVALNDGTVTAARAATGIAAQSEGAEAVALQWRRTRYRRWQEEQHSAAPSDSSSDNAKELNALI